MAGKIELVEELFNVFNDDEIQPNQPESEGLQFYRLYFYVRAPYFSETVDGDIQFARQYRRQFNHLKQQFVGKYSDYFDVSSGQGYASLDQTKQIIHDLVNLIEKQFVIPDKIELERVELTGDWEVYTRSQNSVLTTEYELKLADEFQRLMDESRSEGS